jgi:biopolymer transport protein TolR
MARCPITFVAGRMQWVEPKVDRVLACPILNWEMIAMAFSTNGSGRNGLSSEINVTPLIDVLLVMLIIFMVIVPVMPRGLGAVLPSSRSGGSDEAGAGPVVVEVEQGAAGINYRVDGRRLDGAEVPARLVELLARRSVRSVLLKGDGGVAFGVIAGVINADTLQGPRVSSSLLQVLKGAHGIEGTHGVPSR